MNQDSRGGIPEVQVERHPPERRQRKTVSANCGCCCTCCCCLHSLGGLIGAGIGSAPIKSAAEEGYYIEDPDNPGQYKLITVPTQRAPYSAVGTYWATLGILCGITVVMPLGTRDPEVGIVIVIMGLPAVQIAASFVALIVIACRGGTRESYLQIGKITLGTILGTVLGLGALWLSCFGMSGFRGIF